MSSVFILIDEAMPVNGTYPSSAIVSVHSTETSARERLNALALVHEYLINPDETVFFVPEGSFDPEKFEYIEYRIEEHAIETGENA